MNTAIRALTSIVAVIPIVMWIIGMGLSTYRLYDRKGFEEIFGYEVMFWLVLPANLIIFGFMAHMLFSGIRVKEKKRWVLVFCFLNFFAPSLWLLHNKKAGRVDQA
ncbi:hypothetical protein [Planctomicrobium sp. SH527]|uniref:hypothetical protein n=1 Tax=Planctomicrobium sp. SH527 TaxID=3448123 RepID=UPI003F5B3B5D